MARNMAAQFPGTMSMTIATCFLFEYVWGKRSDRDLERSVYITDNRYLSHFSPPALLRACPVEKGGPDLRVERPRIHENSVQL